MKKPNTHEYTINQTLVNNLKFFFSKKHIFFLVLVFESISIYPQLSPSEIFKSDKERFKLDFNFPQNLTFKECNPTIIYTSSSILVSFLHYWESENEDVLIIYAVRDLKAPGPKYPNLTVFSLTSHLGNYQKNNWHSPHNKTQFYHPNECELINADIAGKCVFKLDKPFMDGYNICVMQFAQKNDLALIETYYLFKEWDLEYMLNVVKNNYQMIKFEK